MENHKTNEQTKIKPFTYKNSSIINNEKLKSNNKTKNITILNSDKSSKFKLHESVITNEFKLLKEKISNSKEIHITKKVSNKSIELMINYMYTGELLELDEKDQLNLTALLDDLGNSTLSGKLIDNMTTNIGIKYPKDSFSKIFTLISFLFIMLCSFYAYFHNLANTHSLENNNLKEIITKYKTKYDDLVAHNKKTINKEINHEDLSLSDFSQENKELIKKMGETISELKQKVKEVSSSANTDVIQLIEKEVRNLKNEIEKKQEVANNKYRKIIMEHRNAKYDKIADENFKYYYLYNDGQINKVKGWGEREIKFNNEIYEAKFNVLRQNATEKYKEHDHIAEEEKRLLGKVKELQEVKTEWKNYIDKTKDQLDKLKTGIIKNKNPSLNKKRTEALTFLKSLYINKKAIDNHLKENIKGYFDNSEFYELLYKTFGNRNFLFKKVMNSAVFSSFEEINKVLKERIISEDKLLFYAVTPEDRILGGYLDIPFPDIYNLEARELKYVEDKKSFIFNINVKTGVTQVHHALDYSKNHFSYRLVLKDRDFEFALGDIVKTEGVFFKFRDPEQYTIKEIKQFIHFGYSKVSDYFNYDHVDKIDLSSEENLDVLKKFKYVKVFKIKFLD